VLQTTRSLRETLLDEDLRQAKFELNWIHCNWSLAKVVIQRREFDAVNLIQVTHGVVQRRLSAHISPLILILAHHQRELNVKASYDLKNLGCYLLAVYTLAFACLLALVTFNYLELVPATCI